MVSMIILRLAWLSLDLVELDSKINIQSIYIKFQMGGLNWQAITMKIGLYYDFY